MFVWLIARIQQRKERRFSNLGDLVPPSLKGYLVEVCKDENFWKVWKTISILYWCTEHNCCVVFYFLIIFLFAAARENLDTNKYEVFCICFELSCCYLEQLLIGLPYHHLSGRMIVSEHWPFHTTALWSKCNLSVWILALGQFLKKHVHIFYCWLWQLIIWLQMWMVP